MSRANGEGSTYRRKDGRLTGAVTVTDPQTGRRRRVQVYGKTKGEIRQKLDAVRQRVVAGAPAMDSSMTVAAWSRHWRQHVLPASGRAESTRLLYDSLARRHVESGSLADIQLRDMRPSHITMWLSDQERVGYAPASRRLALQVLRQVLDAAVADRLIGSNPAEQVDRPRVPVVERQFLEPEQVLAVLEEAEGDRLHPLFVVIAFCGLRKGEALGLAWDAVDLEKRTLRVRATLSRVGKRLTVKEPKWGSRRTVPLIPDAMAALTAHRARQATERLAAGSAWDDTGLVFTNTIGRPLEPRNVLRAYQRHAQAAGVDGSLHTLRHAFVSAMLSAGVPLKVVSEVVGHSSVSITGDLYGHVAQQVSHEAADRLDAAYREAKHRRQAGPA